MVSFEIFVKSMPPSLSEFKVTPSFCFPFKIPDDPTASTTYLFQLGIFLTSFIKNSYCLFFFWFTVLAGY